MVTNTEPVYTNEDRNNLGRLRADFPTHDFSWSRGDWLARPINDYDVLIKEESAAAMRAALAPG